jgi:hypothetical protein
MKHIYKMLTIENFTTTATTNNYYFGGGQLAIVERGE